MDLKVGQGVQMKYCPNNRGTVSKVTKGWKGTFTVTYASPERGRGGMRERYTYPVADWDNFAPWTVAEVRILEDDE